MITIPLNDLEVRFCTIIGKERQAENERNHIASQRIDPDKTDEEIHIQGVCGEWVVCKYLNAYPDFTIKSRHGSHDLVYRGWKIDAKNTHPHRNLMIPCTKEKGQSDIYVVVSGTNPYEIVGWTWEDDLMKPEHIFKTKYNTCWRMMESELFPPEKLLDIFPKETKPYGSYIQETPPESHTPAPVDDSIPDF
jgi:hypothetical protein